MEQEVKHAKAILFNYLVKRRKRCQRNKKKIKQERL